MQFSFRSAIATVTCCKRNTNVGFHLQSNHNGNSRDRSRPGPNAEGQSAREVN